MGAVKSKFPHGIHSVGDIQADGLIDGVDLASFKSNYDSHGHPWSEISGKPSSYTPSAHGNEAHSATYITTSGVTYEALNANSDVGTGSTQVAKGDHNHSGVYEPANATILKQADVDDTPVNGVTNAPISSNWAYDHANASNPHGISKSTVGLGSVENTALSSWGGSANITTLGTISSGSIPWSLLSSKPSSSVANIDDAVNKRHSQNTDTGTTSSAFLIDSDGATPVRLKASGGALYVRNSADTDEIDLVVKNLTVTGTTTTVNSETVTLADNILVLNSNYTGSSPTENGGIEVERGTLTNASIIWDEASDVWKCGLAGAEVQIMRVGDAPTSHTLSSHSDVTISSIASGEILKWNGSAWINNTLSEAGIQSTISGGATSILSSNLTASRALVSDGSGKVAVSTVTSTELSLLSGIGSALATQSYVTTRGYITGNQTITISGDITGSGTTSISTSLSNNSITPIKLNGLGGNGNAGQLLKSDGDGTFSWVDAPSADSVAYTYGNSTSFSQTSIGTSAVAVYSLPKATYRSGSFELMLYDVTNSRYERTRVSFVHDGTTADYTEEGRLGIGSNVTGITMSVAVNGANIELRAQGTSANNTVKGISQLVKV